jgi:putative ABC transport system permease protein
MIPLGYNVRSLAVRSTSTAATLLGLALVVFILASVQMLANGIKKTLGRTAAPDAAIVLSKGSTAEYESSIDAPSATVVLNDQALSKAVNPAGVAEFAVAVILEKVGDDGVSNVQIRGTSGSSMAFRPGMTIVAGRAPNLGADEAMVGQGIRGRLKGLELNQSFELQKNRPLKVVGIFADGGSSNESEVWTDVENVRTAFRRPGIVSSIRVRVPPAKFDGFKASIEANRLVHLQVLRETDYYEKQSENTSLFVQAMGTLVALFFSVGAMMGAIITMHASVANRQREIGVLRALGFAKRTILLSFLLESILLALAAGAIGIAASLAMSFTRFSIVNMASFSETVFTFEPTPAIMLISLAFATVMGLVGGISPALKAARVLPVEAMRA